jgi:hypothetical protein
MTIHSARIEPAPAKSGDGRIRAKLYNQRRGLKEIVIASADADGIDALAVSSMPEIGERVTILLPTGSEVRGAVSWVRGAAFSVALDREAIGAG